MSTFSKPQYILFAGGNGSGKSTLKEEMIRQGVQLGEMIDLDALAKKIGYEKAAEELNERMKVLLSEGKSFTQETTTPSFIRLRNAKNKGFETTLFFLALDDENMCVDRVASRVEQGGHDVSEKLIRQNYRNSFCGLSNCIPYADKLVLFDNTHSLELVLVAENQRALCKHSASPNWVDQFATPFLDMSQVNTRVDHQQVLSHFLTQNYDR